MNLHPQKLLIDLLPRESVAARSRPSSGEGHCRSDHGFGRYPSIRYRNNWGSEYIPGINRKREVVRKTSIGKVPTYMCLIKPILQYLTLKYTFS